MTECRFLSYGDKLEFSIGNHTIPAIIPSKIKKCGDIYLPETDNHFVRWLNNGTIKYQINQLKTAISKVNNKGLFVDIGGHVGLMTRQALELGFKKFIAFEPNVISADCFAMNVKGDGNLHVKGLASKNKKGLLEQQDNTNSGTMIMKNIDNENSIDLYKLDDIITDEKIDLMKIDVEGFELEVLEGARNTILKSKPVILIEQSINSSLVAVEYLKSEFGMSLVGNVGKDYILDWS